MSNSKEPEGTIICRCEDITVTEIERAIDQGFTTIEEIKRLLRCGMGSCQGRTCLRLIAGIICRKTGRSIIEVSFPTIRPPIRPVPLAIFLSDEDEK